MTPEDLKARREALGLSQAQLAVALDISVRSLQNWESGHRGLPTVTARWLDEQLARLRAASPASGRRLPVPEGHRHRPQGEPINAYPFAGPIEGARRPNPRAHGNVAYEERCRCGATRRTNVNINEREYGPWTD